MTLLGAARDALIPARRRRPDVRVWPREVPRADCLRVVDAMRAATPRAGAVLEPDRAALDPQTRRCAELTVAPGLHAGVLARMQALAAGLPGVARGAAWELAPPKFLAYGADDHFGPHRDDGGGDPRYPADVRARRYALVCLLCDDDGRDGLPTFEGGGLIVHAADGTSTSLTVPAGSVVAFPAGAVHEVAPVLSGLRCSVVTWVRDVETSARAQARLRASVRSPTAESRRNA